MRLTKKAQYGLLLCLYISRAGRATMADAAANLKLSESFLEQVARKLRLAGLLVSVRGVNGGYEMPEDPSVLQILSHLSPVKFLTDLEAKQYTRGEPEHRALARYVRLLHAGALPILSKSIRTVEKELTNVEVERLHNLLQKDAQVN